MATHLGEETTAWKGKQGGRFSELYHRGEESNRGGRDGEAVALKWTDKNTDRSRLENQRVGCAAVWRPGKGGGVWATLLPDISGELGFQYSSHLPVTLLCANPGPPMWTGTMTAVGGKAVRMIAFSFCSRVLAVMPCSSRSGHELIFVTSLVVRQAVRSHCSTS